MTVPTHPPKASLLTTRRSAVGLILGAPLLAGCAGMSGLTGNDQPPPGPSGPPQEAVAVGKGQVKVGLILPMVRLGCIRPERHAHGQPIGPRVFRAVFDGEGKVWH